jgi:hypothetical protein
MAIPARSLGLPLSMWAAHRGGVQGELRWRLGSRNNPTARTALHEAIDAGAIIPVAPSFLRQEIEEHLPRIASETGVGIDMASSEWGRVQDLIRFYAPVGEG